MADWEKVYRFFYDAVWIVVSITLTVIEGQESETSRYTIAYTHTHEHESVCDQSNVRTRDTRTSE